MKWGEFTCALSLLWHAQRLAIVTTQQPRTNGTIRSVLSWKNIAHVWKNTRFTAKLVNFRYGVYVNPGCNCSRGFSLCFQRQYLCIWRPSKSECNTYYEIFKIEHHPVVWKRGYVYNDTSLPFVHYAALITYVYEYKKKRWFVVRLLDLIISLMSPSDPIGSTHTCNKVLVMQYPEHDRTG